MKKVLAYDISTRVLHWLFVAFFIISFSIGKFLDDESPNYVFHMISGLMLLGVVSMRIIHGFAGSHFTRFTHFDLNLGHLVGYFKSVLTGTTRRVAGHNPASSWAALVMFFQAIGLGITGILLTSKGENHTIKEIHEVLANTFALVAGFHVLGILLHTLKHKDLIGLSMIHGFKTTDEDSPFQMKTSRPILAFISLVILVVYFGNIIKNYDPVSQTINFFGTQLQLTEEEENKDHEGQINSSESEKGEGHEESEEAEAEEDED